jgi:IS5 family transposase
MLPPSRSALWGPREGGFITPGRQSLLGSHRHSRWFNLDYYCSSFPEGVFDRGRDGDRCPVGLRLVEATPRRVKSSARRKSNEKIKEEQEKREAAEGNLDRTGKPLKFKSDVDSNWVVRDEVPFYGMKEHAAIDVESGLILSTYMTKASENETNYLQSTAVRGMQGKHKPPKVYADKGYCSQGNREFLHMNEMADGIMRKDYRNAKLTELEHQRNNLSG